VNAFNSAETVTVQADGRVYLSAPARGYNVYVRQSEYVAYTPPSTTASIEEEAEIIGAEDSGHIKLFPNPASERVTIKTEDEPNTPFSLTVTTTAGKTSVSDNVQNPTNTYDLNTQKMEGGLYIIKVKSKNRTYTRKLIIQH
jgi:alpha-amylase